MNEAQSFCLNCGAELHVIRSGKKFCSTKCRQAAFYNRQHGGSSNVDYLQAGESQPNFAELTIIPASYIPPPVYPQIEVVMNNGNRLLFYQTPSAEFVKRIVD